MPSHYIMLACIPLLRPLLGGKYTPTGTARLGPTLRSRATTRKRGRRFNLMEDEVCITKTADEGSHLKPESIRFVDGSTDTEIELGSVSTERDWTVEKTQG